MRWKQRREIVKEKILEALKVALEIDNKEVLQCHRATTANKENPRATTDATNT